MNPALRAKQEKVNQNRTVALQAFYEVYIDEGDTHIKRGDAFSRTSLSEDEFNVAQDYLNVEAFVTYQTMGGMSGYSKLTLKGIKFFESTSNSSNTTNPQQSTINMPNQSNQPDVSSVFIVHGRNLEIRNELCIFLRCFGLRIIEWGDAVRLTGSASPSTYDVVRAGINTAQAIVVIFSGDDEAKLSDKFISTSDKDYEKNLTPQARPNVILEAGMALAIAPTRTIIVEAENTRPISDIAGINTVRLKNTPEVRYDIKTRLENAQCYINAAGVDWLRAGDLDKI